MLFNALLNEFVEYMRINERSPKTIYGYQKDVAAFLRFYEARYNCPCYVEDVSAQDIEDFVRFLKAKGLKPQSRNRIVHAFRSLYKFAVRRRIVEVNVAEKVETVRIHRKERTYLTPEEVSTLIESMENPLMKLVTNTLFNTGLRISECLNLRIRHVDFPNRVIRVVSGKGRKDRLIPINEKLCPLLEEYRREKRFAAKPDDPFFATETTGRLCASYYNHYLRRTTERQLGWTKRVTAHTLRHSFASTLVHRGANLVRVQKLLGHSSLATTSVYTHATLEDLTEAVNVL